jgi:hypothetical protein
MAVNLSDDDARKVAEQLFKYFKTSSSFTDKRRSSYADGGGNTFKPDEFYAYMKNTGDLTKRFGEDITKLSMAFKGGLDVYTKLEKATRDQEGYVRTMNKTLVEHIRASKDSVAALRELGKISAQARASLTSYEDNLKKYNAAVKKTNELEQKRAAVNQQVLDAEEALLKARKNKKSTVTAEKELSDAIHATARQIGYFDDAIDEMNKVAEEHKKELLLTTEILRKQNEYTKHLTEDELKLLENFESLNTESEDYVRTMKRATDSTDAFDKSLNTAATAMKDAADKMEKAFDGLKSSIGKAALELITKSPAIAFKDLLSQLKYNVNQSDYTHDVGMGMSESERDQIIGENRIGLRVLGNGNEQRGLDTGGGREIQKAAWQYGVQGADAEKLGLEYQNRLINQGYGGSAKDTADQMTVMHNLAKDLGLTDDQLKNFYDSLQDMGEIAQMQEKYSNLNQEEQRKAINKELQARLALNNQLGISLERETQLNQESINKKYGGIAQSIMSNIGASQEIEQYNADNPNKQIKGKQAEAYQQMKSRGWDTLTVEQKKDATEAQHQISGNRNAQLNKAAQEGQSQFNAAEINYVDRMKPLVPNMQADDTEALKETQREKSLQGVPVNQNEQYSDLQKNIIDTTNNAFIPFNKAVLDATQRVEGFMKGPFGAPAGTLANGVGSFAGSYLGSALGNGTLGRTAGTLARGAGTLARGAGSAIGGAVDSVAATGGVGVGELATAGMAGIVPIVVGVLGAAAVGVAIGAVVNHFLEGTKLGDAIGSGGAHIMAALGSKDAQEAIKNNDAADKANAATDARMAEINAVSKAEHAAVDAKGKGDQAQLVDQAESLRAAYKQKYGVDLTGGGFGYDKLAPNSQGAAAVNPANPSNPAVAPTIGNSPTGNPANPSNPAVAPTIGNSPTGNPALSNLTKVDDDLANQVNQGNDAASKTQIDQLQRVVKLLQDQLDLAKKADQKSDQADQSAKGGTWNYYKQHIEDVRKGLG